MYELIQLSFIRLLYKRSLLRNFHVLIKFISRDKREKVSLIRASFINVFMCYFIPRKEEDMIRYTIILARRQIVIKIIYCKL